MFIVRKGWVANVLTQEIMSLDLSYKFQLPIDELSLLVVQVGKAFFGLR